MSSQWNERIQHIIDGELVDAGVSGRPDRQLEENLQYLKQLVEFATIGEALVASDMAISSDVQVGFAVYWNVDNTRAEPALARTVFNSDTSTLVGAPESEVIGVVLQKYSDNTADILLLGRRAANLTAAVDDATVAGRYYLSGTNPGKLELQRQALSVPVLYNDGAGTVIVCPQQRNWAEDHSHYRVDLECRPSGTPSTVTTACGDVKQISDVDTTLAGWLPADDASFNGLAPDGAKFGYNINAHAMLKRLWPPFPSSAASIVWDRGVSFIGGTEVPTGVEGLVIINDDGIWWMSDCVDHVPWPDDYYQQMSELSEAIVDPCECPPDQFMRMAIHFSRVLFDASKTMVTSLTPASGSIITLKNCNNDAATTGDLIIDAAWDLLVGSTGVSGHNVIKNVVDGKLTQGPVVEGLKLSGDGVTLTSTAPKTLQDSSILHQGVVTISVTLDAFDRELMPQVIRLTDSRERFENGIPYIGLPTGYESSAVFAYFVPIGGVVSGTDLYFRVQLSGTVAGSVPALTCTYQIVPSGTTTPTAIPTTTETLTVPSISAFTDTDQYVKFVLPTIQVDPGDTVLLTILRQSGDGYSGELGLLRTTAVIAG